MSVSGLPVAVERTLTALLTVNTVTSWKICCDEADQTVVVLRLKPDTEMSTSMAEPVLNRRTQVQYRRKPPCQVRRDNERTAKKQSQQLLQKRPELADSQHDSSSDINELPVEIESTRTATRDFAVQHATPAQSEHINGETAAEEIGSQTGHRLHSSSDLQEMDSDKQTVIDKTIAGFDVGIIKDYTSTLTDRPLQRRLRDKRRNTAFRKLVRHQSDDGDLLICESDDIVMEYALNSEPLKNACVFWYVKQAEKKMLAEECVRFANLKGGTRIRFTEHADTRALALKELHALRGLLQFYLM